MKLKTLFFFKRGNYKETSTPSVKKSFAMIQVYFYNLTSFIL